MLKISRQNSCSRSGSIIFVRQAQVTCKSAMVTEHHIDSGHTAFMFISMGLVQFMTPGLAFFYGGLVCKRNVLTMMMQSYVAMSVLTILWFLIVFSMCFGNSWGLFGSPFTFLFFNDVGIHAPLEVSGAEVAPGIPGILFAGYQCMFAVITPPLMTGAFADRFRFKPYLLFVMAWLVIVYAPVCHWIWGGGWMFKMGVWDWAGGIVVHITAGFSALASLMFVGRRASPSDSEEVEGDEPHNIPFVALGTAMLWFGWFGFNGGSSYASNGIGMLATLNSQLAAAAAALVWELLVFYEGGKPGLVDFCVGAVAGLATVTPTAGFIQPGASVFLGCMAGVVCYLCVKISKRFNAYGFEDALDVWGVHGMGGFFGTVMLGLLADGQKCADAKHAPLSCANPGTVTRSASQFMMQLGAAVFCAVWSFFLTYGILLGIQKVMPIVPTPEEQLRLDEIELGENAYTLYKAGRTSSTESYDSKLPPTTKAVPSMSNDATEGSTASLASERILARHKFEHAQYLAGEDSEASFDVVE